MKPVVFSRRANAHNDAITKAYRDVSVSVATEFENAVTIAVGHISRQPKAWAAFHKHYRKFILKPFPFALAYRELDDIILVLEIVDLRREPGYWLGDR